MISRNREQKCPPTGGLQAQRSEPVAYITANTANIPGKNSEVNSQRGLAPINNLWHHPEITATRFSALTRTVRCVFGAIGCGSGVGGA